MNILIISNIELDTGNASGNTYANWFTGWDDSKIACAYCRDTYPNNDFCDEYYSVSPFNIVKNIFRPWKIGKHFCKQDIKADYSIGKTERKLVQHSKHSNRGLFYFVADVLFSSKIWMNAKYKAFIKDFNPDIVFFFAKSDAFIYENLKYVRKHTNANCVAFYADDVYRRFQNTKGLIYRIFERRFSKVIDLVDYHYGASKLMCEDYGSLFKISLKPLYKGCEITDVSNSVNTPLRIVYAGNLYYGRSETLSRMVGVLKTVNVGGVKALLEIYTAAEITPEIDKSLNVPNVSRIMGPRPYNEIKEIMQQADFVLHVESFSPENISSVRLSYSTKISDCLQSGSSLLVVGPRNIASVEEAKMIPGAFVITEEVDIQNFLSEIISTKDNLLNMAHQTNEYAKKYFLISVVRENLHHDLKQLIERK